MKKIVGLLFLSLMFLFADVNGECGVFSNVLQTRQLNSFIKMEGKGTIYNSPSCNLKTHTIQTGSGDKKLYCGDGLANALDEYGGSLNIDYNFNIESSNVSSSPTSSNTNKKITKNNQVLTGNKYNKIYQDWHHYSFSINTSKNTIYINQFGKSEWEGIKETVTIKNADNKNIKIGKFYTVGWDSTNLNIEGVPNNIEIYKIVANNDFFTYLEASNEIRIHSLSVARYDREIVIKAPKVVIDELIQSNSGWKHSYVTIYADEIDINTINLGQDSLLKIYPYTEGQKVVFHSNSISASSSSTMLVSSGDYYTNSFNIPGSSNVSSIRAIDEEQIINFYINGDFKPGNNPGINSNGNRGNFGSLPAANFKLFINGDLESGDGGTTFNALIYVEGSAILGTETYIKGGLSTGGNITIKQDSKFYWDSSIDNSDLGPCPAVYFQNNYACGIFNTVLTSYEEINTKKNDIYKTCKISVKDFNLKENKQITCYDNNNNICNCNSNINQCSKNKSCTIVDAPKNKLTYTVYETNKNDSNNVLDDFIFTDLFYGNYNFTGNHTTITFEPVNSYEDSDIKTIVLGDIAFNANHQEVVFKEGDYYFNSLAFNKNNITLCPQGDVRLFIKTDLNISKNNFSSSCNGKIFAYVEGNVNISSMGGGNNNIAMFIYSKGDVNIANNSNNAYFKGAITAEGKINITGQNVNFVYDNSAEDFGYGECPLCYALNNNGSWINKFKFFHSGIEFDFPRNMAIINNSDEVLNNLIVSQIETNPSWLSMTSPEHYRVIDQDNVTFETDITNTITYQTPLGNFSHTKSSSNGELTRWAPAIGIGNLLHTELNTTANFGDYSNGGFDNYLAIQTYGINGHFMGSDNNLNYYATYFDNEGRKYSIQLDYCEVPESQEEQKIIGDLDAWDTDHNVSDRNITTKIVNQDFNLTIVFLGNEINKLINVKYSLINNENSQIIYSWRDFNIQNKEINASFNVDKIYKNISVVFDACSDFNGTDYKFFPYNICQDRCNNTEEERLCLRYFKSSDNFAIRPYAFMIFGDNQYKRAGEEFNVTVKAVDEDNYLSSGKAEDVNGVDDYNESIGVLRFTSNMYIPTDDETRQMNRDVYGIDDTNRSRVANCPNAGSFYASGEDFKDGEANVTLNYTETGVLTLRVSEKAGNEFAKVDSDDTPDNQRYIKSAEKILDKEDISKEDLLLFIPYKFETTGEYTTTQETNWTYISNEVNKSNTTFTTPQMAGVIKYEIVAKNKNGDIVRNYTKTCFPDIDETNAPRKNGLKLNTTFDLFLDAVLNINKSKKMDVYVEGRSGAIWTMNKKYTLSSGESSIREWISQLEFENGVGKAYVYINFEKKFNTYENPILLEIKDINTSTSWMDNPGATNVFVAASLNKTIEYRYGSVFVRNISVYNTNEANLTVKYMYYNNEWVLNEDHNASFGYVDIAALNSLNSSLHNQVNVNLAKSAENGIEKLEVSTTHALPYSVKLHLPIQSWLWYHPLALSYKDPSTSNLNCLTHPCVKVTFLSSGRGWAGLGKENVKYKDVNVTVKAKISRERNVSKQGIKKLNW